MTTLHLFPDSNLFLHYRALEEIEWTTYRDFDHVKIIVCRTVQREIDKLKDGRDGRRTRRARKAASTFLEIAQHGPQELRVASPRVSLRLDGASQPSQTLSDQLDYSQPDDQIVGYVARFKDENPDADVRILTRDSGPIVTAKAVAISYEIPDEAWKLEPEKDDRDREILRLTDEIRGLQKKEPRFQIQHPGDSGTDRIHIAYDALLPLEPDEESELLETLLLWHPSTVQSQNGISQLLRWDPSISLRGALTAEAIARYENKEHPEWLAKCRSLMPEMHDILQDGHLPEITFTIRNDGTRPATNARIEIRAEGNFLLTHSAAQLERLRLISQRTRPMPPSRPKPALTGIASMLGGFTNPDLLTAPILNPKLFDPPQHDKEAFYYTERISLTPEDSISLTCDLWRHAVEDEEFTVRVVPDIIGQEITGEVICTVHAENLSKPASQKLIVTLHPNRISTLPHAKTWFLTPKHEHSEE